MLLESVILGDAKAASQESAPQNCRDYNSYGNEAWDHRPILAWWMRGGRRGLMATEPGDGGISSGPKFLFYKVVCEEHLRAVHL
jgi:hypothetical protein